MTNQWPNVRRYALLIFLCGVVVSGIGVNQWRDAQVLQKQQIALDSLGDRASGLITAKDAQSAGGRNSGKITYYLISTFQVDGHPYTHRDPVTQNDYDQTQIGNVVHIKYLSDHPEISRIAQSSVRYEIEDRFERSVMTIGIGCMWVLLIVGAWLSHRVSKRTNT